MEKESSDKQGDLRMMLAAYPKRLLRALVEVAARRKVAVYLVGGTVRDWLLGQPAKDLDLTVATGGVEFCRELIRTLGGGVLVQLGDCGEDAARVVWQDWDVDIAAFRGGSTSIAADLAKRDFTVNAMALRLPSSLSAEPVLIDPLAGAEDLTAKRLRACPGAFENDPLRMLRGFRFLAVLGFDLTDSTIQAVRRQAGTISLAAAERVRHELDLIMASERAHLTLRGMDDAGLLAHVLPELYAGAGVAQPGFHHLDVFRHNLQALAELEGVLTQADLAYPDNLGELTAYLADENNRRCLKYAALCHDIGKPAAQSLPEGGGRVTFHGHDEGGRAIFDQLARRLKWSNKDRERTGQLIAMHMHPFHLCNVRREEPLSRRAALKLCRRAGDQLPGLFLLAMADSLASRGALKPADMEGELVALFTEVMSIRRQHILPALAGPRLLTGRDLIVAANLSPGPIFSEILDELATVQVEGLVTSRAEALEWLAGYLASRQNGTSRPRP